MPREGVRRRVELAKTNRYNTRGVFQLPKNAYYTSAINTISLW